MKPKCKLVKTYSLLHLQTHITALPASICPTIKETFV